MWSHYTVKIWVLNSTPHFAWWLEGLLLQHYRKMKITILGTGSCRWTWTSWGALMWSAEGQAQSLRNICWKQAIECFFLYAGTVKQEAAFLHLTTWSPPERKSGNQPTIRLPYCSSLVTKAPSSVLRVRGGGGENWQVMKLLNLTDQRNIEQIRLDIHSPGTKLWRSNIPPSISYTPPSPCILVPIVTHFLSSSGLLAFLVQ